MATISEISVRLSADNSRYRSTMSESELIADKTGRGILRKLDIRAATTAIATAVGLNIQTIAENFARNITGLTREAEDSLKQLVDVSAKVAAANIANGRALLTAEQDYQLSLREREQLLTRINQNNGATLQDQVRLNQDELELAGKVKAIHEYEAKLGDEQKKRTDTQLRLNDELYEAQRAAGLDQLSTAERIAVLKREIADLQSAIATGQLSQANSDQLNLKLNERRRDLLKTEADARKDSALAAEKQLRLTTELQKLRFEALTPEKQLLTLTQSEAILKQTIAGLKSRSLDTTKEEVDLYGVQNKLGEIRVSLAKAAADEEERNKRALEQQHAREIAKGKQIEANLFAQVLGGKGSRDIQGASDEALKELLSRDRNKVNLINPTSVGPFDLEKRLALSRLQNEIGRIQQELNLRDSIRFEVNRVGVEGARRNFGGDPLLFDKLVQEFTQQREKIDTTNDYLKRLNEKIAGGITVKSLN